MKFAVLLRASAVVLAIAGVVDPSWHVRREMPRPIDLRVSAAHADLDTTAIAGRLGQILGDDVTFAGASPAIARVVVGGSTDDVKTGLPTSFVTAGSTASPNVRIVSLNEPRPAITGWRTSVSAVIAGKGVAGSTSTIVLEQGGVELARTEHKWTQADERADVSLPYVPPVDGAARLALRVLPLPSEASLDDNVADGRVLARNRRLRVLVHEPRPSWAASFVRRVLEANAAFDVSAFVGASKGLAVKAGSPPARLDGQIDAFDAVVVGAPEELSVPEVAALNQFARRRGGSVLLLPDRRPSGPYLTLLRSQSFDEILVEKPMTAREPGGGILRATELALPRADAEIRDVLASTPHDGRERPVVFGWPLGEGRVVFSGALDAWRFRASGEDDFNRFWTAVVSGAALAAPERLELSVDPGVARAGEPVVIRVRLRGSEIEDAGGELRIPAVQARLIAPSGAQTIVRMWPGDGPGTFEGRTNAPALGKYDLQASSGSATADTVLIVADDARRGGDARDRLDAIAAATGGVVVGGDDLTPLVRALRALPAPQVARDVHPARSAWFAAAFASLLCAEWMLRRRSGLR